MRAGDARRAGGFAHRRTQRVGGAAIGVEAQRQQHAAGTRTHAFQHAGQTARGVAEMHGDRAGPRRRRVQAVGVVAALQHGQRIRFVQREELRMRRGVEGDVTAAAAEAGDADALGHVFGLVPGVELGAGFGSNAVPDRHHRFTC